MITQSTGKRNIKPNLLAQSASTAARLKRIKTSMAFEFITELSRNYS
jgi:hypothetical protein